jgi:hypothetical protein
MHSRFASITAIAAISFVTVLWQTDADAENWFDGQEILIECPPWEWAPSQIPGVEYELCFDDINHCTVAQIGDHVCIPSLGVHDVWVTAIDYQNGQPVYYDGDVVSIARFKSADFSGDAVVGFADFGLFADSFGGGSELGDLNGDGVVGFADFSEFSSAFGKCINQSGTVYRPC